MKYKHCEISNKYKTVNKHNPVSGHSWTERVDIKGYRVHGGTLMDRDFSSIEKAKEAIDFNWEVMFGKFANLKQI